MARGPNTIQNDGTIEIFLNSKKLPVMTQEKISEKKNEFPPQGQPDWRGTIRLRGRPYAVSLWVDPQNYLPNSPIAFRMTGEVTRKAKLNKRHE